MEDAVKATWKEQAAAAAESTYGKLQGMDFKLADVVKVDAAVAAGTNSLDTEFFGAILDFKHLDGEFLKAAC